MRSIIILAVASILVGCGSSDDGSGSSSTQPTPVPTSTWVDYDGGTTPPFDGGVKPPAVCTPDTVQCPLSQRQVCSGDGQWAVLDDLPMCSTVCEAAVGRFLVSVDDNTSTDTTTGLTWMWRAGQGSNPCSSYGAGFRLPTEAELTATAPNGGCTPNVDQAAFADQNDYYLASSGKFYDTNSSAFVDSLPYGEQAYSRCVR